MHLKTRRVDGTLTSEVTPVTIRQILTPHFWMSQLGSNLRVIEAFSSIYMCTFILWQSSYFWLRYSKFQTWPWKFKVKVMANVKSDGHIWGNGFNWYVCFLFRGNWTIFGPDIANSIFDLEIEGQGQTEGQIWWSYLRHRFQSICLLFASWQSDHFGQDIADSIFDLENSRSGS